MQCDDKIDNNMPYTIVMQGNSTDERICILLQIRNTHNLPRSKNCVQEYL